jgi:hypothetical protein
MVAEVLNFNNLKSSSMDPSPIAWGATFQIVEQNMKIKEKKEIKKLSQEKKAIYITQ